ncbi:quinone oxidoreductase family protein [Demequina globuliformis]|uniref:quinone oxidoreductase family protein n=1 Tax=Demequina globuliformis TaxID=676202 RepID=UPI000782F8E0|nr:quinone oxidoreductase [Demequina globuliformis]
MLAIIASAHGSPEVLTLREVPDPTPAAGQVTVAVTAAGVNFIDTYQRSGVYPVPTPFTPGLEGAGTVTAVGPEVTGFAVGDRVAWCAGAGSYAEQVVIGAEDCFHVPAGIALPTAAALMLQGLTAHYLSASTFPLQSGHVALVHAGAGGVGLLLTQLAVARGARVITTVSSDDKEHLSREAGASDVVRYDKMTDLSRELPSAIRELTGGTGVDVVYDGVGASTFDGSLASLAPRGTLVLFGGASGQVPAFDLQRLNAAGSLWVTRPSLGHYLASQEERAWRAGELFSAVAAGELNVRIGVTYSLAEAAAAHAALEARTTMGKVLLLP